MVFYALLGGFHAPPLLPFRCRAHRGLSASAETLSLARAFRRRPAAGI